MKTEKFTTLSKLELEAMAKALPHMTLTEKMELFQDLEMREARASLQAAKTNMLGKVTEVALFTERVEVKKTEMSDTELESRIKEKLNKFMHVIDVTDISEISDAEPEGDDDET